MLWCSCGLAIVWSCVGLCGSGFVVWGVALNLCHSVSAGSCVCCVSSQHTQSVAKGAVIHTFHMTSWLWIITSGNCPYLSSCAPSVHAVSCVLCACFCVRKVAQGWLCCTGYSSSNSSGWLLIEAAFLPDSATIRCWWCSFWFPVDASIGLSISNARSCQQRAGLCAGLLACVSGKFVF